MSHEHALRLLQQQQGGAVAVARPVRPWFRTYVEIVGDRKIRRLTPAQRWLWVAILAAARESPTPGSLYVAECMPMTRSELADYADVKDREVIAGLALMQQLGMVLLEPDGLIVVKNFPKRQFESDSSTPRTQRHRHRNDDGTFQPGSEERSENGDGNAPETEADTEPTSIRAIDRAPSSTGDPRFVEFWQAYPKHVGKAEAFRKYQAAVKRGTDPAAILHGARKYAAEVRAARTEDRFVAHPATWLHQGRWDDEPASRSAAASKPAWEA